LSECGGRKRWIKRWERLELFKMNDDILEIRKKRKNIERNRR
jgi:hypothetical protein